MVKVPITLGDTKYFTEGMQIHFFRQGNKDSTTVTIITILNGRMLVRNKKSEKVEWIDPAVTRCEYGTALKVGFFGKKGKKFKGLTNAPDGYVPSPWSNKA